jgi:hypothetical protein
MAMRRVLAALALRTVAALLPSVNLFLDCRMTLRAPADAIATIRAATGSTPDGLIMWESASAPDYGDALDGLTVLAVDPGSKNVEGLPSVRRSDKNVVSLFEPPFDAAALVSACAPGRTLLLDATAETWDDALPLVEMVATAAVDSRLLVSLYDAAMLAACCERLVLGAMTAAALPALGGGAPGGGGAGGVGVAIPPDPELWRVAGTYRNTPG